MQESDLPVQLCLRCMMFKASAAQQCVNYPAQQLPCIMPVTQSSPATNPDTHKTDNTDCTECWYQCCVGCMIQLGLQLLVKSAFNKTLLSLFKLAASCALTSATASCVPKTVVIADLAASMQRSRHKRIAWLSQSPLLLLVL